METDNKVKLLVPSFEGFAELAASEVWPDLALEMRQIEPGSPTFKKWSESWFDRLMGASDWSAVFKLSSIVIQRLPHDWIGWENLAWALHKVGKTEEAQKLLRPLLKRLLLPGPPSGRAAYCMSVFCVTLGQHKEASGWLKLAWVRAVNKQALRTCAFQEPALRPIWPALDALYHDVNGPIHPRNRQ